MNLQQDLLKSRRFFIGNLSEEISQHVLQEFCSNWGELKECKVMKEDDTGRSRGFGFVEFVKSVSADRFEIAFPHIIFDRHLVVKRCGDVKQSLLRNAETKRVLVSHPSIESHSYFLKHFSKFGPISKIVRDFGKDVPLNGYSFIDYADPESSVKCLIDKKQKLVELNLNVDVCKVLTKEQTLRIFQKEREEIYRLAREQTGSHSTSIEITKMRTNSLIKNKNAATPLFVQPSQLASYQAGYLGSQKREMNDWIPISSDFIKKKHHFSSEDTFNTILSLWWDNCHIINRRLSGVSKLKALDNDEKENVLNQREFSDIIGVCKLIPKSSIFSKRVYEVCCSKGPLSAIFYPISLDELKNPHIPVPYRLSLNERESSYVLTISLLQSQHAHPICKWLINQAFPKLLKWVNKESSCPELYSHMLIESSSFAKTYERIKENFGKELVKNWSEKTDPKKFVYEDCVDIRKRKIWEDFTRVADLREVVLNPSDNTGIPTGTDFLIGNHSDELTPWLPIIASRLKCQFFLLPCCPFDLFGKFFKRESNSAPFVNGLGKFGDYFAYIYSIITKLGFDVRIDRLKIPSTKRLCFVGSIPSNGLPEDVEERIVEIVLAAKNFNKEFTPRQKVEQVRNCSLFPKDLRSRLTKRIFNHLLSLSLNRNGEWRCGGVEQIGNLIKILTVEEKAHMRLQNGGLQTFLKNQHQVFVVRSGFVNIRNWPSENEEFLMKQKDLRKTECWFFSNHPDGCPFFSEQCSFRH